MVGGFRTPDVSGLKLMQLYQNDRNDKRGMTFSKLDWHIKKKIVSSHIDLKDWHYQQHPIVQGSHETDRILRSTEYRDHTDAFLVKRAPVISNAGNSTGMQEDTLTEELHEMKDKQVMNEVHPAVKRLTDSLLNYKKTRQYRASSEIMNIKSKPNKDLVGEMEELE